MAVGLFELVVVLDARNAEAVIGIDSNSKWATIGEGMASIVSVNMIKAIAIVTFFVENYVVKSMIVWRVLDDFFGGFVIKIIDVSASAGELVIWIFNLYLVGLTR